MRSLQGPQADTPVTNHYARGKKGVPLHTFWTEFDGKGYHDQSSVGVTTGSNTRHDVF